MEKMDFKKVHRTYYQATSEPHRVHVPAFRYLMVDGEGDPNTAEAYAAAVEALYAVSYTIKFMVKKSLSGLDYGVMPLEGLWWTDRMEEFSLDRKSDWKWTAMIMQPEPVTEELVRLALVQVAVRKKLPALPLVRMEVLKEGEAVQILHRGPYADETPTMERLHGYMQENGWDFGGRHHEIYLNDPRRTAPERLQTVIRQPIKSASKKDS